MTPHRVHLIAPATPLIDDARRLGFDDVAAYVAFVREHLPAPLRLTYSRRVLEARSDPHHGGRNDDPARIRDLQAAISDPRTRAIVASNGGAYFSRLLPDVDFSVLRHRRTPLWALGFSEISGLVNLVSRYRCGRGVYWLCPNWLAWEQRPRQETRDIAAAFWKSLGAILTGRVPVDPGPLVFGPIEGELVRGRARSGTVRLTGGCLAVLAALAGGRIGRRLRPNGHWLLLEDIKDPPYVLDRNLAALKAAGWFERAAGLIVGDFHRLHTDTQPALLELLQHHLPRDRTYPVVRSRSFGHVWPAPPIALNRRVPLRVSGRKVAVDAAGLKP